MKTRAFLFFLLLAQAGFAQNLVQNGSFEDYTVCPDGENQVNRAVDWESFFATPDYFNICSISPDVSVPQNDLGFQYPAEGNGYIGLFAYWKNANSGREQIGQLLSSPLKIGKQYTVSIKISMAPNLSFCACNGMGVKFSTNSYAAYAYQYNLPSPIVNNVMQVYVDTVVTDTTGWTTISGDFIADSAYQYIIIGNFLDDAHITTLGMWDPLICDNAYYYLDDVVLVEKPFAAIHEEEQASVRIYSAGGELVLQSIIQENIDIQLFNTLGQPLERVNLAAGTNATIPVHDYPRGYYVLLMTSSSQQITKTVFLNP